MITKAIKIPSPSELGMHIPSWRSGQEEAINVIITSEKRVTALCAPTGFGKSPVAVAAAILSGVPTCIVTSTRGLQDQYLRDFAHLGMVDIRGRRNYNCNLKPNYTCEEGQAARCPYKGTVACRCSQAEMRAAASSLVVTNYAKWCAARRFGQGMDHFKQVIFDEGHEAPSALANAMQVILYTKEIEETLKLKFPVGLDSEDFSIWKRWCSGARIAANDAMIAAQARITGIPDPKPAWVRHFTHMRNLCRRLATLSTAAAKEWIVEQVEQGYQFDPIRPGRYGELALLLKVPRIIFVSATLRPKTLYMVGVSRADSEFKEFDSDFDPKRCPIYYIPTQRVDKRNPDNSLLWARLDQIAATRRDRKGIIHTVSYARRDEITTTSRFSSDMLINPKGEPPTEMITAFKAAPPGTILVSPTVGTGYDFPGRDCEWQFLCKIPFEPPSKIVKAREADDPEYRPYKSMQALVQTFGRGMRSKSDRCENFIGDDHMEWFRPRYAHLAPRSFHGFYRTVNTLPAAPEKL
jgi:Rad3-related DNA helicase